jgi:alpha-glucosidase
VLAQAPIGNPAVWARANVAIPFWPEMQHVGERPPDPLTLVLHVDEGVDETSLYEDRGDGWDHELGIFARRSVRCETTRSRIVLEIGERLGGYVPKRERVVVELRGLGSQPRALTVDGRRLVDMGLDIGWDERVLRIVVPEEKRRTVIEVAR